MARNKNKKKGRSPSKPVVTPQASTSASSDNPQNPAPENKHLEIASEKAEPLKKPQAPEKKEKVRAKKTAPQSRGKQVSVTTCIAGMLLCLVLGIYLGTLAPDILGTRPNLENTALKSPPPKSSEPETQASSQPQPDASQSAPNMPAQLAERITSLNRELGQNPKNASGWVELGNLYFDTNQTDKAIHAYEHALELKPDNPDVLTDLGIMYREGGNFNKAVECFRKASSIQPNHVNAIFNEGVVLATDLRNKPEAIQAWGKLLNIDPNILAPNGKPVREMIQDLR